MTESAISNHCGMAAPQRYFYKPSLNKSVNESISKEAVYRTALATPGLLNSCCQNF